MAWVLIRHHELRPARFIPAFLFTRIKVACVTPHRCFRFRVKVTGLTRVLQHISKRKNHPRDSVISVDLANSLIAIWDRIC